MLESLFHKVTELRPATLFKRDSNTGVFSEYCELFKKIFFYRTPLVAVPEIGRRSSAADNHKLITNNNLRCEQQRQKTNIICNF